MSIIPSFFGRRTYNYDPYDPFGFDLWDPFQEFFLDGAFSGIQTMIPGTETDWKETPSAHIFKMDLPGFNKNEVKVEVEHGKVLQISGERNKEVEEKNDKWHHVERSSGKFKRRFKLPQNAMVDQMKVGLENGVLTVTVPKAEAEQAHSRLVQISN